MATSIVDYMFRELAVSYLGRTDLAHVQPADLLPDTLGEGQADAAVPEDDKEPETRPTRVIETVKRVASSGYMRRSLTVLDGGRGPGASVGARTLDGETAQATSVATDVVGASSGNTALASGTVAETRVEVLERPAPAANDRDGARSRDARSVAIQAARARGYEGDPCPECQNLTLVRNGTCLKCDTCGGTTGCS
jgi:ribonucleoside-diphosphate reductase alpha chain